jgi:hypothetical protein
VSDEPRAANVVEALLRVMADLPGIGRDERASQQQGGYAYRGIEAITAACQPLFARHGVLFTPHVRSYEIRDLVVNGKPWTDIYELVEYTVYGPGGREDSITVGPILSVGRDNSDKGGNKCLTQAYKYALIQALCIADAKDDGDTQTHEAEQREPTSPSAPEATRDAIEVALHDLTDEQRDSVKEWWKQQALWPIKDARFTEEQADRVLAHIAGVVTEAAEVSA